MPYSYSDFTCRSDFTNAERRRSNEQFEYDLFCVKVALAKVLSDPDAIWMEVRRKEKDK